MKKKHYVGRTILTILAAVYAFSFLLPTLVTFTNSFMTQSEIAANYGKVFETAVGGGGGYIADQINLKFIPDKVSFAQ